MKNSTCDRCRSQFSTLYAFSGELYCEACWDMVSAPCRPAPTEVRLVKEQFDKIYYMLGIIHEAIKDNA